MVINLGGKCVANKTKVSESLLSIESGDLEELISCKFVSSLDA